MQSANNNHTPWPFPRMFGRFTALRTHLDSIHFKIVAWR